MFFVIFIRQMNKRSLWGTLRHGLSMVHSAVRCIEGKSGCPSGEPFRVVDAVYFRVGPDGFVRTRKSQGLLARDGDRGLRERFSPHDAEKEFQL